MKQTEPRARMKQIYAIEWTHGDGMDQHQQFVSMDEDQANVVRDLLETREALDPHVYLVDSDMTYDQLVEDIKTDLPLEDE